MNADELDPKPAETEARDVTSTEAPDDTQAKKADRQGGTATGEAGKLKAEPRRGGSGIAGLALVLALLAMAAAAWMWWHSAGAQQQQAELLRLQQLQYQSELQKLQEALATLQSSASQKPSSMGDDLQRRLQALEGTQSLSEDFRSETSAWTRSAQSALEESQARLNAVDERLRTLSARSAESDSELELEEIDYLLRMAQERLQLFGDTRNADRALQLADQQVLAFDNPMFIALRREIAAARQALAAADVPDMVAMGAELDKVQDSLGMLPFKSSEYETESESAAIATDPTWWDRLKSALSGLVTIQRIADTELAMPALADQQALRQRAWLQIEQARLAALSREQDIYQDALAQAVATINRWFSANDAQVKLSLSALQALQQRNVNPPMPDISGPWTTLRSIRGAGLSPAIPADSPGTPALESPAVPESSAEQANSATTTEPVVPVSMPDQEPLQATQDTDLQEDASETEPVAEEAAEEAAEPEASSQPGTTAETDQ